MNRRPSVRPSIRVAVVEDGYLAYDVESDRVHHLNPTAALILECCDGKRDVAEIWQSIAPLLPQEVPNVVEQWLETAEHDGVITFEQPAQPCDLEIDADELMKLADLLREEGRVDEAFLCQQRAAEMKPGDAKTWYYLGELAHIVRKRDIARAAYEKYLQFEPDDREIQHILTALADKPPPDRASDECIRQLYSKFSSFYKENMRGELDFRAPERLLECLAPQLPPPQSQLRILDLGCGTGFAGELLKPWAARLTGIDLSPEMIAQARQLEVYDSLEVAEITAWLNSDDQAYDLVVACDTLIYFGELGQVFHPVAAHLAVDGLFAFTNERGDQAPFKLSDSGRYTHHCEHIREAAMAAGFATLSQTEAPLREEYGETVAGIVTVLRAETQTAPG